jgi:hypothetical protein
LHLPDQVKVAAPHELQMYFVFAFVIYKHYTTIMKKKLISILFSASLLLATVAVSLYQDEIIAWNKLRSYTAPDYVVKYVSDIQMTEKAKKLFYLSTPQQSSDKIVFRNFCNFKESSVVLGCYKSAGGIFVFLVEDERLAGVNNVTVAHEMLHAAYDRFSAKEIDRLTVLLEAELTDLEPSTQKTIDQYQSDERSVRINELHSIIGTEKRTLAPELEAHYAQYFQNRQKIVDTTRQYYSYFEQIEQKVAEYDVLIADQTTSIKELEAVISTSSNQLNAWYDQLQGINEPTRYNNIVSLYNNLLLTHNSNIKQYNQIISEANANITSRNQIAAEEMSLFQSIDTRVQPVTSGESQL